MITKDWDNLSYEEKNKVLYEKQKKMLEEFLVRGAISKAQYEKSLNDLTEKDRCMSAVMKTAPPSPWCCLASLTADIHYFRQRTVLKTMPLSVDFFFHFPHLRCCGSLIIQHIN